MVRAAFDPRQPAEILKLGALADLLRQPHVPSATLGRVADVAPVVKSGARIAVVLHLFYPDLWDEIADAIKRLPERFDLFVSCPVRVASAMRVRIGRRFPGAVVFGIHNLGRDVLPFLLWLRAGGGTGYTYVLKLHGKKSVHIVDTSQSPFGGGEEWRRLALDGLIGDAGHARAMLAALDAQSGIGLVAAQGQLYDQVEWKCGTTDLVATALARLGIQQAVAGGFPAGTMFWARTAALAPLAKLPDSALDFEREAGQVDGTLHHAYERLMALVAASTGHGTTDSRSLLSLQTNQP
jgi:lipopolysaccharide biosynthesis protein